MSKTNATVSPVIAVVPEKVRRGPKLKAGKPLEKRVMVRFPRDSAAAIKRAGGPDFVRATIERELRVRKLLKT